MNIASLVDELGRLEAQIADLSARRTEIKDVLLATGQPIIQGHNFKTVIAHSARETVDIKRLRQDLGQDIVRDYLRASQVTSVKTVLLDA